MSFPDISIVLATQGALPYVSECLKSLCPQLPPMAAELIVADSSSDGTAELIRSHYPDVMLLHHDRPVGLPELMREALEHAGGRIVALVDPGCVFPADWLEKLLRAHESEYCVIGGAVENGHPNGLANWACYMVDYGAFMLPARRRVTPLLPGIHLSYKRPIVELALKSMPDGFWKVILHSELTRRGVPFLFEPELVTHYSRPDTFMSFLRRYYRRGWYFAAMRCKRMSRLSRFLRVALFPALPVILFCQRMRAQIGKKAHRLEWFLTLPLQAILLTGWAAGELTGFILGPSALPAEVYQ
ncbi:MAG: glycosyltransferase family 2 protein [Candidatus Acidiferrales bacterium]